MPGKTAANRSYHHAPRNTSNTLLIQKGGYSRSYACGAGARGNIKPQPVKLNLLLKEVYPPGLL
jgi:hypothetical protein